MSESRDQKEEVDVLSVINTSTLAELRQMLRIAKVLGMTKNINALSSGDIELSDFIEIDDFISTEINYVTRVCNNRTFALEMFAALFDMRVALTQACDWR